VGSVLAGILAVALSVALGVDVDASPTLVEHHDVAYGHRPGERLDAFLPAGGAATPAVLVVHGGGWKTGSKEAWDGRARALARQTGWATFSVEYDLAAARPWVTQPADIRAALAWVRRHATTLGVDGRRVALLGSSAGGHLSMLVGTTASSADRVAAVVSWSGPADLPRLERSPAGERRVKDLAVRYAGGRLDAVPRRWIDQSPVAHVGRTSPPMLLAASRDETMVPVDQLTSMRDALAANGVDVETVVFPGRRHASQYADDVWRATVRFLREHV
jgi:acetyl esterase/lipase